jgi:hypothetical protein
MDSLHDVTLVGESLVKSYRCDCGYDLVGNCTDSHQRWSPVSHVTGLFVALELRNWIWRLPVIITANRVNV